MVGCFVVTLLEANTKQATAIRLWLVPVRPLCIKLPRMRTAAYGMSEQTLLLATKLAQTTICKSFVKN
jgi:hypothetical protein